MGLIKDTQKQYYEASTFGNYQFTSLDDIITQFEIGYVGENKIIPKIKRADIAFHAMRALQELSFDTFKSVKSQQIDLPPSMVMPLPHDYVNYTKISWSDSAGIKHPLYPTKHTSNPFQIEQDSYGVYQFDDGITERLMGGGFDESQLGDNWSYNPWYYLLTNSGLIGGGGNFNTPLNMMFNYTSALTFEHRAVQKASGELRSGVSCVYQAIDVTNLNLIDLLASGVAADHADLGAGTLRVGISTAVPPEVTSLNKSEDPNHNTFPTIFDLVNEDGNPSYLEWTTAGNNTETKQLDGIDVSNVNTVYVIIVSFHDIVVYQHLLQGTNKCYEVSIVGAPAGESLTPQVLLTSPTGNEKNSSTWNSYKSTTSSENNNDDYRDDTYWPANGERYGLEPSHAQVNGSFYIDNRLGRIHFSSNISGKTVILDYISDSLGTDAEMQVHKFAEDAMYKWIAHAILSASSYGQGLVRRLTREKFAAVRKAKLRLSNIKIEELTQILRGKSKHIKH